MAQILCNFVSYSLGYGVDIAITLPTLSSCDIGNNKQPCHTPKAKYPVLYLLHGRGNDYKSWYRYTSVERYAEERRIAAVCCSVGNKAYMNAAYGEKYFDFIENELPEFMHGNFPVSERPEDTYIAGLSMGGYGALAHMLTHPASYKAVGAFSPATELLRSDSNEFPPRIDLYKALDQCLFEKASLPELFLCCGQNDFLYDGVAGFHRMLEEKNVAHRWYDVPGFEHEWKFWDIEVERFLDWLPRTDAYANAPLHKL